MKRGSNLRPLGLSVDSSCQLSFYFTFCLPIHVCQMPSQRKGDKLIKMMTKGSNE